MLLIPTSKRNHLWDDKWLIPTSEKIKKKLDFVKKTKKPKKTETNKKNTTKTNKKQKNVEN